MPKIFELSTLQQSALEYMQQHGLPSRRLEDWKYTDLTRLLAGHTFTPVAQLPATPVTVQALAHCYTAVLVDGRLDNSQSQLPQEIEIASMQQRLATQPARLAAELQCYPEWSKYPLLADNTARFSDGLWISVPSGIKLDRPLHIIYQSSSTEQSHAMYYRHVVHLAAESALTIIEDAQLNPTGFTLLNTVLQATIAERAHLHYYGMQRAAAQLAHFANLQITQQQASQCTLFIAGMGTKISRFDIHCALLGEQSHCELNGFYVVNQQQHFDLHSCFAHQASETSSVERVKGIAAGKAHGVFNGKVFVAKGVKNIDAQQSNQNLLLSLGAEIDTKPELEIYADAVTCSHGATVGQLDPQALFYLQARGISHSEARQLLTAGFVREPLEKIHFPGLQEQIAQQVTQRLQEGF